MPERPLVSVVTPVHNGEAFLAECIESVLAQSYDNWEYTIVNNCSTDGSLAVAERYAHKDSRVRVLSTDRLLDVMGSQNTAFRQVSPKAGYCKMVHADDWLFRDCLQQMVDLAEAHPTVGIVGAYRLDGASVDLDGLPYPSTVVPGKDLSRAMLLGGPRVFGSASALLYRAGYVRRRPSFFDESDFHADVAACYEILCEADFGFVHQVLTFTRTHPGEQSSYASRLKTYVAGRFRHLVKFGPGCMEATEYETRLQQVLAHYYRFLARRLVSPGAREVLAYHRSALEQAGYPFSWKKLLAVVLPYWGYAMKHPAETARLVWRLPSTADASPRIPSVPRAVPPATSARRDA
ncbi:MAG: glycosyltransferase family 2 protein [Candidatus Rokuibacteriota bacterium]